MPPMPPYSIIIMSQQLCNEVGSMKPAKHFSYFAFRGCFTNVFAKHITKYETFIIHFSHFMQISCFINAAKK